MVLQRWLVCNLAAASTEPASDGADALLNRATVIPHAHR
jgi:hypothetical protein